MNIATFSVRISAGNRELVNIGQFSYVKNGITFLFGESGIGKSIICKSIYGLLDSAELNGTINGKSYAQYALSSQVNELKKNSFFVFQEPSSHLNPLQTIAEQLSEGDLKSPEGQEEILKRLFGGISAEAREKILSVYPKPYRPSGGEKQRILLTMAFKKIVQFQSSKAGGESLFVFDEPTGSLDNRYRNNFLDFLFEQYQRSPFTAIVITHDYSIISEIYNRHKALVPNISLLELQRRPIGGVELVEFSAQKYLTWVGGINSTSAKKEAETICTVQPRISIFGRELRLCHESDCTKDKSLELRRGQMVYVKAPSGVGKTTLAKCMMGLYHPQGFSMELCGRTITDKTDAREFRKHVWGKTASMVFQHADESLDLEATVAQTFAGLSAPIDRVDAMLRRLFPELAQGDAMELFLKKRVKFLSGGQKQRLNVLRTVVLKPDLIILDEPLNALDFVSSQNVLALLDEAREAGSGLLMISHNEEIFDKVVGSGMVWYLEAID